MYANLNVSFIKLMRILNDGDVESNPGPTYKILNVVQGPFHQGDIRFGGCYGSYPRDIYPRDSYPPRHLPTMTLTPNLPPTIVTPATFTPRGIYPHVSYPLRQLPPR